MDTSYFIRRRRELREWWLLRRNDPAAVARQQHRQSRHAPHGHTTLPWGDPVGAGNDLGPEPKGPQKREIVGVGIVALLLVIGIGSFGTSQQPRSAYASPTSSPTTVPTSTVTTTTTATTTPGRPSAPPDLAAVPVGQSQTIRGESAVTDTSYTARVTVTKVTRTSDHDIVVAAKIDVLDGRLPIGARAWTIVTVSGQVLNLDASGPNTFGDVVEGRVAGDAEGTVDAETRIRSIRFQPPSIKHLRASSNQAAVWSVSSVTTALTSTPTFPADATDPGDVPEVNAPDLNVPGDCVNGRDRRGRFC